MKKVVSVVGKPIRAIGRMLLKLLGKLRFLGALRTPLVKLSRLRGKALAIALAPILVVVILLVLVLKPEPDQEDKVRETLDRYEVATRDKDYQTLCDDLYASKLLQDLRAAGLPCEVALRPKLEELRNPELQVLSIKVNGDLAAARARTTAVGEPTSVDTIRLVKEEGDWKVLSLSEAAL